MQTLELELAGQLVDLPEEAEVALSYQVHDLHDLEAREAEFSETFTLLYTHNNLRALELAHSLDSDTPLPYRLVPAVLRQGGAVLLEGTAFLERSSAEGYEVTLTGKGAELFTLVADRPLRALDLSALDHPYAFAQVQAASAFDYEQGFCYPLVDDGRLTNRRVNLSGPTLSFDELAPAVYSDTVLRQLLAEALPGWQVAGSLLSLPEYRRHVLYCATGTAQHRAAYLEQFTASAAKDSPQTATSPGRGYNTPVVFFQDRLNDPNNRLGQTPGQGTVWLLPDEDTDYQVKVRMSVRLSGESVEPGAGSFPKAVIRVVESERGTPTGNGDRGIVQQAVLFEGEWSPLFTAQNKRVNMDFTVRRGAGGQNVYVQVFLQDGLHLTILPGATVSFEALPRVYPPSFVHLDASLPEQSQGDFLRLLFTQFNVMPQLDTLTRTVRLDLFNDVTTNRRAGRVVDWTGKLDFTQRPQVRYRLEKTSQQTEFLYAETEDEYGGSIATDAGQGALLVDNHTLPAAETIYEAEWAIPENHFALVPPVALPWLPYFEQQEGKEPDAWVSGREYPANFYVSAAGQIWHSLKPVVRPVLVPEGAWLATFGAEPGSNSSTLQYWEQVPDLAIYAEQTPPPFVALTIPAPALPGLLIGDAANTAATFAPTLTLTADGLRFGADLLPAYYPGVQGILDRVRVLEVGLRLNAADIAALDFTVPVRLNVQHWPGYGPLQGDFYLNLIDQYLPGSTGPVTCELIALGGPFVTQATLSETQRIFDYTFDKTFN